MTKKDDKIIELKKILHENFKGIWDLELEERHRKDHCAYMFEGLKCELEDLIQETSIKEFRKGYNQCLKDLGKTGEKHQGLYL